MTISATIHNSHRLHDITVKTEGKQKKISIPTISFFAFMFLVSCSDTSQPSSPDSEYQEIYIRQFKLTYFRELLAKAYNHSEAVGEIIATDHSGFAEPILSEGDYRLIDSLTRFDNQLMTADSLKSRQRAEGAKGKRPLGFMLDRLTGKWLDSLARQRLKLNGVPEGWQE